MSWIGVITDSGRALLDQWSLGGHTLTIDKATVGSGTRQAVNMRSATDLAHEEDEADIVSASQVTGGTKFKVQVGPAETTAYVAHEIGLWAHIDSENSVMIALHQDSDTGVDVPTTTAMPDFVFALVLIHALGNGDDLSVTINPNVYVSQSTLDEVIAEVEEGLGTAASLDVFNNLTTASPGNGVLDAYQGKMLKNLIDGMCVQPGAVSYTFVGAGYITTGKTQIMVKFPIDKFIGNRTIASYSVSDFQVRQNGNNIWASSEGFNELELVLTPTNAGISINAYRKQNGEHVVINSAAVNNATVGIYLVVSITWA